MKVSDLCVLQVFLGRIFCSKFQRVLSIVVTRRMGFLRNDLNGMGFTGFFRTHQKVELYTALLVGGRCPLLANLVIDSDVVGFLEN